MRIRGWWLGVALAAGLSATATAQPKTSPATEKLITPLPPGFALGWKSPDGHTQEFVRAPETVENWTRLITLQIFRGLSNVNPDSFAERIGGKWAESCPGADSRKLGEGNENGFPFAVRVYACPLLAATRKPETMWLKAIAGAEALYVIQYAAREMPSAALMQPAAEFLRPVIACDTTRPDRPCPAGVK